MSQIETKVEGSSLIIKTKRNVSGLSSDVKVYVSLPDLKALVVSGSGDVYAKKTIKGSGIELSLSGSGDIDFDDLQCTDLELNISGSGDITMPAVN